jgi:hypothetical protein
MVVEPALLVPFDFRQFRDAFLAHHGGFHTSAAPSDISVLTEISDGKKLSPALSVRAVCHHPNCKRQETDG